MPRTNDETRWNDKGKWIVLPAGTPVKVMRLADTIPEIRYSVEYWRRRGKVFVPVEISGWMAMLPKGLIED